MHFYHQNNVFCHPPDQLRTQGEIDFPMYFPPELPPLSPHLSASSANNFAMNDDGSSNCWSSSNNGDATQNFGDDVGPPMEVYADDLVPPNVDSMTSKFGMSYTTAHVIETKLAKMLNDIQAPKSMYAAILQCGCDAYSHGYNFVPRHGNKESLINSLQTQLHLEYF
jgi:hypothetical protein